MLATATAADVLFDMFLFLTSLTFDKMIMFLLSRQVYPASSSAKLPMPMYLYLY
jgi:hypothetical protein